MKEFELDVSGEDLLSKNYTICIANRDGSIIYGFKFNEELVGILSSKYGQRIYKYQKSQRGKATFKIRLYCIVVFYLLKAINERGISLTLCRDFQGREKEIQETILAFLKKENLLETINQIYFQRLPHESNAHKYAYLMAHDTNNKMSTYIKLSLNEIEKWLKK